jgi:hypothetical protein
VTVGDDAGDTRIEATARTASNGSRPRNPAYSVDGTPLITAAANDARSESCQNPGGFGTEAHLVFADCDFLYPIIAVKLTQ